MEKVEKILNYLYISVKMEEDEIKEAENEKYQNGIDFHQTKAETYVDVITFIMQNIDTMPNNDTQKIWKYIKEHY